MAFIALPDSALGNRLGMQRLEEALNGPATWAECPREVPRK